jgi:hypothetical protein
LATGESVTIQLPPVLASGAAGISISLSAGTLALSAGMHAADLQAHADSPFSASTTVAWYVPGAMVKLTASGGTVAYKVTA